MTSQSNRGLTITRYYPSWDGFTPSPYSRASLQAALRHLSRFHSYMGNWAHHSNFCLRMFPNSLTGDAFQWYTTLPAGSVKTWEQMQELFLSRFVDTTREVQLSELCTMTQHRDEPVEEYITRWQKAANRCQAPLSQELKVNLCRNGIKNEISLLMNEQITTFQALATEACRKEYLLTQQKGWKKEPAPVLSKKKKPGETSANTTEAKPALTRPRMTTPRPEPEYSFTDEEVLPILKDLLATRKFQLPEPTKPNEVGRESDPRYCHYHRNLSHPTSRCRVLKMVIQKFIEIGAITPKTKASSNTVIIAHAFIRDWEAICQPRLKKYRNRLLKRRRYEDLVDRNRAFFTCHGSTNFYSSCVRRFIIGDYFQPERLIPFYRTMAGEKMLASIVRLYSRALTGRCMRRMTMPTGIVQQQRKRRNAYTR